MDDFEESELIDLSEFGSKFLFFIWVDFEVSDDRFESKVYEKDLLFNW